MSWPEKNDRVYGSRRQGHCDPEPACQIPANQETELHRECGHAVTPKTRLPRKNPARPHFLKITQTTNCCHPLGDPDVSSFPSNMFGWPPLSCMCAPLKGTGPDIFLHSLTWPEKSP